MEGHKLKLKKAPSYKYRNLEDFGRLDTSFMPSKNFRFVKKPYGMPGSDSGPKISNPDVQVQLES